MKKNEFYDFVGQLQNYYPKLFKQDTPLSTTIAAELFDDVKSSSHFPDMEDRVLQRSINRFISDYIKEPTYIALVCRSYLMAKPRQGLHGTQPVLKGEVRELLVNVQDWSLQDEVLSTPIHRYYVACKKELGE